MAILLPVVIFALFTSIQIALYYLAREQALGAAQEYVTAQRQFGAPVGAGNAQALAFLNGGHIWLSGAQITAAPPDPTQVTCVVTGTAISLIPGVHWTISEVAHGTIERTTVVGP